MCEPARGGRRVWTRGCAVRAGELRVYWIQRLPPNLVRGHRSESSVVLLARPDADDAFDRLDEDLPVADGAGARALDDRIDRRLHERLGADHLDLDLVLELQHHRAAAIVLETILLAAVTAGAAQRDAGDSCPEQRLL